MMRYESRLHLFLTIVSEILRVIPAHLHEGNCKDKLGRQSYPCVKVQLLQERPHQLIFIAN